MNDLKQTIANNITELRKASQLTQLELAERLNYSDKAISKWERAESIPDVVVLKQIADIFGVTVDYLLQEEHNEHAVERVSEKVFKTKKRNRLIVTLLANSLVWLIATMVFVYLGIYTEKIHNLWINFRLCISGKLNSLTDF